MKRVGALLLVILFSVSPATAWAADPMMNEPVVVNGDKVEYFHDRKEVIGTGNISITYRDVVLTCERISVHLDTKEAVAQGNVKINQKGAYFTGDKVNYNFGTRKALAINGYVNAKPFYGKAAEIDKVAYKDQLNLERGYITTCDLDKPHYRIQSRRLSIYFDEKVTAQHILFFVGDCPVMYFPYYVQSLKDEKTHITVIPGQSGDWGYYALTAFRFYFNDDNRGDLLLDYRTKKGLAGGINYYYDTKKVGDGDVKFYYTNENDLVYERTGDRKVRWRAQARHRWDIGHGTDTLAMLEFNKMSDPDVIKDYFYNEYEELGIIPDNYVSFVTQKSEYSTKFLMRKRFDKFFAYVERLPEFTLDIPNWRVTKEFPIYYKAFAGGVYLNKTFDNVTQSVSQKDANTIRFDLYNQLSYAARFLKSLSVTPYGGIRNTYYSRNRWGETNQFRTLIKAGVDNSMKFYKVYPVETNILGLDMHKLRHIVTPTASYYFTHQPTISPDNLTQYDEIDALDTANGFLLSLENRLQTKRPDGDQMRSVDLLTFTVSTDYMFRLKKSALSMKENKFKSVDMRLELYPYPWAYLISDVSVSTKKQTIQLVNTDLVAHSGDKWSLAVGHRYEDVYSGKANLFSLDANYRITPLWKVRAYERINIKGSSFEEQEYTVSRDLHCWIAEFTYNHKDTGENSFWFAMRLKAFPDYPVGFRRTYSRPRFGSIGG